MVQVAPPPSPREVRAALSHPSVVRAVWLAVRDERLRAAYRSLRSSGLSSALALEALASEVYTDERGRRYHLSAERLRTVVLSRPKRSLRASTGPARMPVGGDA